MSFESRFDWREERKAGEEGLALRGVGGSAGAQQKLLLLGKDPCSAGAGMQGHAQGQEGKIQLHAAAQAMQVFLWTKLWRKIPKQMSCLPQGRRSALGIQWCFSLAASQAASEVIGFQLIAAKL